MLPVDSALNPASGNLTYFFQNCKLEKQQNFKLWVKIYWHVLSDLEPQNWKILEPKFGEVRTQKPPKRGHFMNAKLVSKMFKIFNLTTTNVIVMKLTTIMYLYDIFSWTENWGVTYIVSEKVKKQSLRMSQEFSFFSGLIFSSQCSLLIPLKTSGNLTFLSPLIRTRTCVRIRG